ncbi:hypothetical protein [Staphylococcus rostri]|uniref:hypothetical protein n=1 Tax=Staphylococcus rostri TaxID=522262 RepID=UPI0034A0AE3D
MTLNKTFIEYMNKKALEIGMREPNFKNPSGLSARGQLSNSYDLTLLTLHASFKKSYLIFGLKNNIMFT